MSEKLKNPKTTGQPFRTHPSARSRSDKGFALVVTLSLMILLTVIAVGLLSLSSISLRASTQGQAMAVAQSNARLALMLAIGDLQKSLGPDQRITAAADILPAAKPAKEGRAHWTGVWDTRAFNPATPDTKAFVRWLVSDSPSAVADAKADATTTDVQLFTGNDAATSVKVPKVTVDSGSYAYWVEDLGLKADLGWSEGEFTNNERKQSARLSAAPGPDHGSFEGPFSGKTNYPVTKTAGNLWLDNLDKALSTADMPLVMGDPANQSIWLRDNHHDMTLGSRGVLADSKKGGLRRDLSLAFEMDDAAESPNTPNFNQQTTEFVGNGDTLSAPKKPAGLPVNERFLWRDMRSFDNPFSSDIVQATKDGGTGTNNAVMRGPNWWALRDYANLYKRLSGTVGDYTLQARAYYPNRDSENIPYSDLFDFSGAWGDHWVAEERIKSQAPLKNQSVYIYRPARPSYAPVNLGISVLMSARNLNGKLAVVLDPIVYLWNPYNRKLKFDSLRVVLSKSFPGRYEIKRIGANPATYEDGLDTTIPQNFGSNPSGLNFTIQETAAGGSITMNPGEVMVATPVSAADPGKPDFKGAPGYFTGGLNSSGIVMTRFCIAGTNPKQFVEVPINAVDTFSYTYKGTGSGERFDIDTNLPNPNNPTQWLQTQNCHMQVTFKGSGWNEYEKLGASPSKQLTASKQFFGLFMQLMKPALFGPSTANPNPVEVFSRFNPAPMLIKKDFQRSAALNQTCRNISDTDNNLLNNYGIRFSGFPRNTFWGASYEDTGSTSVPASNIPTSPLMSLVEFSHANLSLMASDPFHAVGNSWSNPIIPPSSVYGKVYSAGLADKNFTAADHSWLMNDALFDRYYLTGLAPDHKINAGGYSASGTLKDTVAKFFSADYQSANANPVMRPYLPPGETAEAVVDALIASDGYKKAGAYSLIDGVFNVNSTSIPAWTALLRANRNLAVTHAQGGTDSKDGSPFPRSSSPTAPGNGAQTYWSGFSRLADAQIDSLATEIVKQVKRRGPFMSISDFVNHRVGTRKTPEIFKGENYMGALQAAIDATTINDAVRSGAGGTDPDTSAGAQTYMPGLPPANGRKTTTGIPTDITQADLLLPLAPRLTARSDTYRIRGYGEASAKDGKILARATCEAVVQRYPEYVDPSTDAAKNEPWDEGADLNVINKTFGRRLNVVSFRWLNSNEI